MTERKKLVKKIRRVTTLMRQKMLKNASINGNWYKLFKSYGWDNSGNISFAELAYVVYKELDISKLEMSLKERSVWGVVDINGDNTVTVEGVRRWSAMPMEANKIDHVILRKHGQAARRGPGQTAAPPSPTKSVQGGASVTTRATSPPIGRTGRHLAALGPSEEPQAVSTWLSQYRRIIDYKRHLADAEATMCGNPPEENATIANMVPRLEYNLKRASSSASRFGE